jgi:hypothetical protein
MTKKISIFCNNCGVEKTYKRDQYKTEAWLTLSNQESAIHISDKIRLQNEMHFCSLGCLNLWSEKAVIAAPKLVKAASSLHPRGTFSNDEVGLEY